MICDEAHNIESMIMNQLMLEFSRTELKEYIRFNLSKTRVASLESGDYNVWIDFIEQVKARYETELEKIELDENGNRLSGGEISLDLTGKAAGRGAYVCKDPECFMNAVRKKGLERSLKCRVDAQVYEGLRSYFEGENS